MIVNWVNRFRAAGSDALRPRKKGRKKTLDKSGNTTQSKPLEKTFVDTSAEHVRELEDELLKLRIENAFLKELRRLRLEDEAKMRNGYIVSMILMTGVWLVFLIARYLPVNVWIKAGTILIISCIWMAFTNDVYAYFAEHKKQLTILSTDFSDWSNTSCVNANVYTLILIFGGIVGGGLLVYGLLNMKRKRLK